MGRPACLTDASCFVCCRFWRSCGMASRPWTPWPMASRLGKAATSTTAGTGNGSSLCFNYSLEWHAFLLVMTSSERIWWAPHMLTLSKLAHLVMWRCYNGTFEWLFTSRGEVMPWSRSTYHVCNLYLQGVTMACTAMNSCCKLWSLVHKSTVAGTDGG